jgi:hypothetical protein
MKLKVFKAVCAPEQTAFFFRRETFFSGDGFSFAAESFFFQETAFFLQPTNFFAATLKSFKHHPT